MSRRKILRNSFRSGCGNASRAPSWIFSWKLLGRHRGIIFHTIGQRAGLGISHPTPLYVLSIDSGRNLIVVGEKKDLMANGLVASDVNILAENWPKEVHAKIRYRKKDALCRVTKEKDKLKVVFAEGQEAITPGQSVVFYDHDRSPAAESLMR